MVLQLNLAYDMQLYVERSTALGKLSSVNV